MIEKLKDKSPLLNKPSSYKYFVNKKPELYKFFNVGRRFGKNTSASEVLYQINYLSYLLRGTWRIYLFVYPEERI